ncbi:MAG TPA: deoxyribodipyrimidine photo-lyase [Chitinophaga sp.]|nr:deoxyribodipyrimidine photo-lyase [Chitinophaga sp.]
MNVPVNIFWFRRDLRLEDNAGLYYALKSNRPVLPVFIFDRNILDQLEDRTDRRVNFIRTALEELQAQLVQRGFSLRVYYDTAENAWKEILNTYKIENVFANHDYEPYARERDAVVGQMLTDHNIGFHTYKDQVIFEKKEVIKEDGTPYTMFTPYSKKWRGMLTDASLKPWPTQKHYKNFLQSAPHRIPSLSAMGFHEINERFPTKVVNAEIVKHYTRQRDFPAMYGTSHLGVHLRFGTISIRALAAYAKKVNETFLNELIWREFYQVILWFFPHVGRGGAFKEEYDAVKWRNDEAEFEKWCTGQTGYPMVDAGMRELNATGFMHNRVRMIVASFLTKHLLIDWRWGEAYFANKLLDFDLAANNGNWQWVAGCGCDAAPYFRVFNPYIQTQKFDPDLKYIRRWVPELDDPDYPQPIVDHEFARKRCLEVYNAALKG